MSAPSFFDRLSLFSTHRRFSSAPIQINQPSRDVMILYRPERNTLRYVENLRIFDVAQYHILEPHSVLHIYVPPIQYNFYTLILQVYMYTILCDGVHLQWLKSINILFLCICICLFYVLCTMEPEIIKATNARDHWLWLLVTFPLITSYEFLCNL